MKAITVIPGRSNSVRLEDVEEPISSNGSVLVQTLAVGVCGTDGEIVRGEYGFAPPNRSRLILGHESLGRVIYAPDGVGFQVGDLVAGIVRQPDPVPCASCAVGEWDMCRNGRYAEHGIKELDGFAAERFSIAPRFAVKVPPGLEDVGVLLEPTSVVAKAWEQIERIGARAHWRAARALITGAGPIGLLAALLGVQRGLDIHVLDRATEGPKPGLVTDLGATYYAGPPAAACIDVDVVLECTGVGQLVFEVMKCIAPSGIVCLTGVSSGHRQLTVDMDALNRELVLENNVVFGTVNANRRHYEAAADALVRADRGWLKRLIARRVPLARWAEAFVRQPHDVKTVIDFTREAGHCLSRSVF
jgi:threonine dehydrogenase-like Zn-dependent dehydrogenase